MVRRSIRLALTALGAVLLGGLLGCAEAARPEYMVPAVSPTPTVAAGPFHKGIAVARVGGGEETQPWMLSRVANDDLRVALEAALARRGYLSDQGADAPYRLDAFLVDINPGPPAITLVLHAFIRYTLTRVADGTVLMDEVIDASFIATIDDAFYGVRRLQLANEGAIRANIAELIARLDDLETSLTEKAGGDT